MGAHFVFGIFPVTLPPVSISAVVFSCPSCSQAAGGGFVAIPGLDAAKAALAQEHNMSEVRSLTNMGDDIVWES